MNLHRREIHAREGSRISQMSACRNGVESRSQDPQRRHAPCAVPGYIPCDFRAATRRRCKRHTKSAPLLPWGARLFYECVAEVDAVTAPPMKLCGECENFIIAGIESRRTNHFLWMHTYTLSTVRRQRCSSKGSNRERPRYANVLPCAPDLTSRPCRKTRGSLLITLDAG